MNTRAITLVAGLALLVAACGAEADQVPDARADSTVPTQATEGTSTTMQPESPSPTQPENDSDVGPDTGEGDTTAGDGDATAGEPTTTTTTTTASDDAPSSDGPVDVGGGKIVEPVPVDDAPVPMLGEAPSDLMKAIMDDVVGTTGAQRDALRVIRAEFVTWNDGSLGCPQPGVMFTQATVPGYWVVIDHAGTEYDYRANDKGFFVRCKGGVPPSGNPSS